MKTFESPLLFAEELLKLAAAEVIVLQSGLKKVTKIIEKTAKREIGHLQPAVGSFEAWPELAESTKDDKERLGYVFNDDYNPLLRTGELQDSIKSEVKGLEGVVGSNSDIMVYQEFGTRTIPARPVLGPAAFRNKKKIKEIVGIAAVSGMLGSKAIHPSLGYNFDTRDETA